jgi:peptide/nickel transport system permease protein
VSGTTLSLPPAAAAPARRARRWRVRAVPAIPLVVLGIVVFSAILAPLLTPYDPLKGTLIQSLTPPVWVTHGTPAHLLGTDSFGRDVFTRMIYGARVSLAVAGFSLLIAVSIGTFVGVVAGYVGGAVEGVLMRITDALLALPAIIVALTLAVAVGPSFRNLILVLGFLIWPNVARLIRAETLLLKQQEYVKYSRAIGVPAWAILIRHIIPNLLPTLLVAATLQVGHVILAEATLSFLGAGIPAPSASWGVMVSEGQGLIATGWWIAIFPGIAITLTVMSFNFLSDWLRDVLDPKTQQA